ncbi:MAG: outer membrane beta-barrel protein [Bacteroidales bacterium]
MKNFSIIFILFFCVTFCFGQGAVSLPNKNPNKEYERSGEDKAAVLLPNTGVNSAYNQAYVGRYNAHSLPKVEGRFFARSEVQLKMGTCLPLNEFGRKAFESNFKERNENGANPGFAIQANYNFYPFPVWGFGFFIGANLWGYDQKEASTFILSKYATKEIPYTLAKSHSWYDLNFGLSFLLRIPLSNRLYLTGNVNGRFLLLTSPALTFTYTTPPPKDTTQGPDRYIFNWQKKTTGALAFGSGIGLLYRFTPNISMLFNVDYVFTFIPTTQAYIENKDTQIMTDPTNDNLWKRSILKLGSTNIKQNYSNLSITLGVSYAF